MFTAFLVPAGRDRFELYSEPPEEPGAAPAHDAGRIRQWMHAAHLRWHGVVDRARRGESAGIFGRWRDAMVCRLAESIAEQRTMWALRRQPTAQLQFPTTIDEPRARRVLERALGRAEEGIACLVREGLDAAMRLCNGAPALAIDDPIR